MKILLVDDEASIERLVSRMITDAGYEFAYAENGFDALAAIEREKPDLVIMDVMTVVVTQEVDDIISSPVVKETIINNSDCKRCV